MSPIHVIDPGAGQTERKARPEGRATAPQVVQPGEKSRNADEQMMYAWSIGITSAARSFSQTSQREEGCPPEVYIG